MIKFVQRGDFSNLEQFLKKNKNGNIKRSLLEKYGREGVAALSANTPVDTGKTADSWYYEIVYTKNGASIVWKNSNIVNGVPIAVILQYGHATRFGGYVQGRDYINPAMQPIFDKIAEEAWREVSST